MSPSMLESNDAKWRAEIPSLKSTSTLWRLTGEKGMEVW
jgi:hypothetical protein